MKKYLCIYLPMWSINLAQRRLIKSGFLHERPGGLPPVMLVAKTANQITVQRCCRRSSVQGVRAGMTLALAKALVPDGKAALWNPPRDFELLQKLALKLTRISPLIALDNELVRAFHAKQPEEAGVLNYGLVLDLSGAEWVHRKNFGSYENLLGFIKNKLSLISIEARLALAPTIGTAWALSRFGANMSISGADSRPELSRLLAPLPVQALRLSSGTCAALEQVGIRHVGELLAISRKALGLRFGIALVRRIDQALGAVAEAIHNVEDKKCIICRQEFEVPLITHEQVERALLNTLVDLLKRLYREREKPLTILLSMESFGIVPEHFEREIALISGTQNLKQLHSIFNPIIEKVRFKEGVRFITLKAVHTQPARDKQVPFLKNKADAEREFSQLNEERDELLNNFVARLGADSVNTAVMNHSYIPERAFSFSPVKKKKPSNAGDFPPLLLKEQPPYLLSAPESIQAIAMLPDKPPSWIKWREEKLFVLRGSGPDRIAGEWWHKKLTPEINGRDYFKVQDQNGRWLWIYREQRSLNWFVHGIWA